MNLAESGGVTSKNSMSFETRSGLILMATAAFAIFLDNSPLSWLYDDLLSIPMGVSIGAAELKKPILLWVNDGLMAIFFLLVGLEIKREVLVGELSRPSKAVLPAIAAAGGMAVPALIFVAINRQNPSDLSGWAIPAATDIAFALGVVALLGKRVPVSIKVFLTALAIIDDLGAIVIIAIFYTSELSFSLVAWAILCIILLVGLNRLRVVSFTPYVLLGIALWLLVLKSGVHATLAGVVLAFAIPLRTEKPGSPLETMEHALQPWIAFLVLPTFAFANAGVSLRGFTWSTLVEPLPLGIAAGLFIGKQVGVFLPIWLSAKLGIAKLPTGASWSQVYGASLLAGIGFTMSLFIGTLAFEDSQHATSIRLGVLAGSLLSGLAGYTVLRRARSPQP